MGASMRSTALAALIALVGAGSVVMSGWAEQPRLRAVPFTNVRLDDVFWTPRLEITRSKTLPHNFEMCERTGRIRNFVKAAGAAEGEYEGYFFNDSDVYKVLEGAAYALHTAPDAELDGYVDEVIAKIAGAQQSDGYLNSYYTLTGLDQRWTDLANKHELYCAGHLFEAAVAHYQATGKRTLLDVAIRFADLIDSLFGPDKRHDVPGHEEIELALVKLYGVTGEARYLKLAQFFLEQRGRAEGRRLYGDYCQDHLPLAQQTEIAGHAVRAMYLYSGVADVAALTGDDEMITMMERIWRDVVERKMYITGGIGPSAHNEGFTVAYDLPNDSAYAETCASIGMVLWNQRLSLLHADARYVDVLERALYNGLLSGIALDGEKYFYVNPLASRGTHHRREWYSCACCPTNIVRFLPSVGGYVYAHTDDAVYVNLYVAGEAKIALRDAEVSIKQETRYPWDGAVRLTLTPTAPLEYDVYVRIPGWCEGARLRVNGAPIPEPQVVKGYTRVSCHRRRSDVIELDLPMPIRRIEAHPRVPADSGRVALQRGPLVYCLEGVDNAGGVLNLALPREAELTVEHRADLLGGVTVIRGPALAVEPTAWDNRLYRPAVVTRPVEFVAVPYYAWDNRAAGEMAVWLPESPTMVEPPPVAWLTPTASHCYGRDTLRALHDRLEPTDSGDHTVPRFTWWPKRGTQEWVQYEFDAPRRVSGVEIYWFDDERQNGGCRVPASWKLLARSGEEWQPVTGVADYGTARDQYNFVTFDPIETSGLRIEAQLQENMSAGILEWRVDAE
ncbi:MAG: glycoside hydrolase family 127 protein [Planctomycetes bacterium]|nr:glycoside hydrolase family 127 protein [Planctomycetota bacterium]